MKPTQPMGQRPVSLSAQICEKLQNLRPMDEKKLEEIAAAALALLEHAKKFPPGYNMASIIRSNPRFSGSVSSSVPVASAVASSSAPVPAAFPSSVALVSATRAFSSAPASDAGRGPLYPSYQHTQQVYYAPGIAHTAYQPRFAPIHPNYHQQMQWAHRCSCMACMAPHMHTHWDYQPVSALLNPNSQQEYENDSEFEQTEDESESEFALLHSYPEREYESEPEIELPEYYELEFPQRGCVSEPDLAQSDSEYEPKFAQRCYNSDHAQWESEFEIKQLESLPEFMLPEPGLPHSS
ncbi:hypothetical protein B0H63DRAFT_538152 [Podospora didyma]|uniref:Uncharacterized protein n=1 Tax=Podospora didyma TaxID=330526 RepID=A0AAE0U3Y4_9PEZI|nr:hypothetical protein B0H63DRAFT_538152 [Podospora didyma]